MRLSIIAALAAGALFIGMEPAAAATKTCASLAPPDATGALFEDFSGTNDGCEVSDLPGPKQPSLATVNAESFFDTTDWVERGKIDTEKGAGTDGRLTVSGSDIENSGSWSISGFVPGNDYMLLFKSGKNKLPGFLVGYLVDEMSGGFSQMFYNAKNGKLADDAISNIRLLERIGVVPLPAGALLIGSAFLVAGVISARARRKAA